MSDSSWNEVKWSEVKLLSRVRLFATPWTVAYQAPPSVGFSRQEYWSGLPFPSPGDLPNPGIEPGSPVLQADALPSEPPRKSGCLTLAEWPHNYGYLVIVQLSLRTIRLSYSSSVYSCHLFLISSASVTSLLFVLYLAHPCIKCSLELSNLLEEIFYLSHSTVFFYYFALFIEESLLIPPCCSLELCIQLGTSFLFSLAFHFSSFLSYL